MARTFDNNSARKAKAKALRIARQVKRNVARWTNENHAPAHNALWFACATIPQ